MQSLNVLKLQINNKLLFKLSCIGYALNSTLFLTNRIPEIQNHLTIPLLENLENGQSIFISLWGNENNLHLDHLVNILKTRNIKLNFYLMDEPNVDKNLISYLLPYSIDIFCQNNNYDHSQVHCMPIGIRDCENVVPGHKGFSHFSLYNEKNNIVDKSLLCLLCFTILQEPRHKCYEYFKDKKFITNLNENDYENTNPPFCGKVPININYSYLHKSFYALCPKGIGEDTHRFYEAIYLNTIPIVKRTNTAFDKIFNIFPCLIIDEWEQITENFLEENLKKCTENLELFHKNYPNAFTDLESIQELLLKT
jgi:hypothetical protein